jgi:hypothetical protein
LWAKGYDLQSLPWSFKGTIAGEANRLTCRPPDEPRLALASVPNSFDGRWAAP